MPFQVGRDRTDHRSVRHGPRDAEMPPPDVLPLQGPQGDHPLPRPGRRLGLDRDRPPRAHHAHLSAGLLRRAQVEAQDLRVRPREWISDFKATLRGSQHFTSSESQGVKNLRLEIIRAHFSGTLL